MNSVKKLLAVLLALCLICGLCACGNAAEEEKTPAVENTPTAAPETAPSTEPVEEETAPEDDGMTVYTITVVDESGNPVPGAIVQMCKDTCLPGPATNAEGQTTFSLQEDAYKVSFIVVPAGYSYVDETTEFYFENGATELTITLKAGA